VRRTWREVVDDDVLGLAAQLSYYFFLALFPAILFPLALANIPVGHSLGRFMSPQVLELIHEPSADREAHGAINRAAKTIAILGRTFARGTTTRGPVSFEEGRSPL
jgi:uncharacterized BrkB/YihY/UPF0761 family membrane protein